MGLALDGRQRLLAGERHLPDAALLRRQTEHARIVGDEQVALRVERQRVDDVVWSKAAIEERALGREEVDVARAGREQRHVGVVRAGRRTGWWAADRNGRTSHVDLVHTVGDHATWCANIEDLNGDTSVGRARGRARQEVETTAATDVHVRTDEDDGEDGLLARGARDEVDRRGGTARVRHARDLGDGGQVAVAEADVDGARGGIHRRGRRSLTGQALASRDIRTTVARVGADALGALEGARGSAWAEVALPVVDQAEEALTTRGVVREVQEVGAVRSRRGIQHWLARLLGGRLAGRAVLEERGTSSSRRVASAGRRVRVHAAEAGKVVR